MRQDETRTPDAISQPPTRPRRQCALARLLFALAVAFHPALGAPQAAADPDAAEALLRADPAPGAPDLLRAASTLLAAGRVGPLAEACESPRSVEHTLAVARAVAARHTPPEALLRPLLRAFEAALPADKPVLISALGAYPSRDAIRPLIAVVSTEPAGPARTAALEALVRQTGRDDLGADPAQWRRWWEEAQFLTEGDWRARLIEAQTARASRLAESRTRVIDRFVESQRRLYAATAAADRPAFLVQMMGDELTSIRRLAFELADRELLNARVLGDQVTAATLARLTDSVPAIRAAAATLAGNLGLPDAPERVCAVLAIETDPGAAAAMLAVAGRRPSPELVQCAAPWLGNGPPASPAAAEALLLCAGAGLLTNPTHRGPVLEALRRRDRATLSPAAVRLLGAIGESADLETVRSFLTAPAEDLRVAAGEALAARPGEFGRLIDAARQDPALHRVAIGAIAAMRPNAAGFALAAELPAPSPERARAARLRLAEALPPQQLLLVAEQTGDASERAEMLKRVGDPTFLQSGPEPRVAARLLVALAETRLMLSDAPGALAALDALPMPIDALSPARRERAVRTRALSLIRLNRIADAALLGAPASVWLEGLEYCIDHGLEHAPRVQEELEVRFGRTLSESETARLRDLAARLIGPPAPPEAMEEAGARPST